jgi:hypothetical protein
MLIPVVDPSGLFLTNSIGKIIVGVSRLITQNFSGRIEKRIAAHQSWDESMSPSFNTNMEEVLIRQGIRQNKMKFVFP